MVYNGSLELSAGLGLNFVVAGGVGAVALGDLQLEQAGRVADELDDVIVAALGNILAVDSDDMISRPQHGPGSRAVGHDVAQNTRALAREGEPEARVAPGQLNSPHSIARTLFRSPWRRPHC